MVSPLLLRDTELDHAPARQARDIAISPAEPGRRWP
jgi:hypothetical protein